MDRNAVRRKQESAHASDQELQEQGAEGVPRVAIR